MSSLSPKVISIINSARELFWKHGISRVTVEEICENADCSKMTLYRHFENKIEVAKAVLNQINTEAQNKYHTIMTSDVTFSEKIRLLILLKGESTLDISQEFLDDILNKHSSELGSFLDELSKQQSARVKADFIKAQNEGHIRADLNIDFALAYADSLSNIIQDEALKSYYKTPQELILEVTNLFFYGIGTKELE